MINHKTTIQFILPVRHPENVREPQKYASTLLQTINSIAAQSTPNWRCTLVANYGSHIPRLPTCMSVVNVDLPPNRHHDDRQISKNMFYRAVRNDKGKRVLAGILSEPHARFAMVVDDDDLISKRLSTFIEANSGAEGWYIENGREFWHTGKRFRSWSIDDFWKVCGSSVIFRPQRVDFPNNIDFESNESVSKLLGSHHFLKPQLEQQGYPLTAMPFEAAAYRRLNPNSHSSTTKMSTLELARLRVVNKGLFRHPLRSAKRIRQFLESEHAFLNEFLNV